MPKPCCSECQGTQGREFPDPGLRFKPLPALCMFRDVQCARDPTQKACIKAHPRQTRDKISKHVLSRICRDLDRSLSVALRPGRRLVQARSWGTPIPGYAKADGFCPKAAVYSSSVEDGPSAMRVSRFEGFRLIIAFVRLLCNLTIPGLRCI